MNKYNIIKQDITEVDQLLDLVEMLELADQVLEAVQHLEPEDCEIDVKYADEFAGICRAWRDGLNGYVNWSSGKDLNCVDDCPMNMVYNLQDAGWVTSSPAYVHSREIVDDGYGAYETVLELYKEEIEAIVDKLPTDWYRDNIMED